jgi:PEP-CTERM motif
LKHNDLQTWHGLCFEVADYQVSPADTLGAFEMMKTLKFSAVFATGLLLAGGAAHATPVPAGTLTLQPDFNPIVNLADNTVQLLDSGDMQTNTFGFLGGTSQFAHASTKKAPKSDEGTTASNVLSFGATVGSLISYSGAAAIDQLFVFTDTSTGVTYDFSLDQSITTLSNVTTGQGTNLSIYLLGDLTGSGSTSYADRTPTAITLSMTITGGSNVSISGTLSNPPPATGFSTVPEPASMTLLGGGLAALGFIRRRKQ